jgi:hypothetical protein
MTPRCHQAALSNSVMDTARESKVSRFGTSGNRIPPVQTAKPRGCSARRCGRRTDRSDGKVRRHPGQPGWSRADHQGCGGRYRRTLSWQAARSHHHTTIPRRRALRRLRGCRTWSTGEHSKRCLCSASGSVTSGDARLHLARGRQLATVPLTGRDVAEDDRHTGVLAKSRCVGSRAWIPGASKLP